MKRVMILFMAVIASMMFSSCTKEIYIDPEIANVIINVRQKDWEYTFKDNNNCFFATVRVPEITRSALKGGIIKTYRVYSDGVQAEMPIIRPVEYMDDYGDWRFNTEVVDYEVAEGLLTILYTLSDFDYELDETFVPEAMQFRTVILY